jgi:hypothetical protein
MPFLMDISREVEPDDPRERQRWLATQFPRSASNASAVRFFGTQLLTVRIDLDAWRVRMELFRRLWRLCLGNVSACVHEWITSCKPTLPGIYPHDAHLDYFRTTDGTGVIA